MNRAQVLTLGASVLAACTSTDPGSGAAIQYYLPKTNAVASLTMIIETCPDTDGNGLAVKASLGIVAKAAAQSTPRLVSGAELASVRTKRSLTITVSDIGVISGVNSVSEDRTTAIISNSVAAVTKLGGVRLAPVAEPPAIPEPRLQCNQETEAALSAVHQLREQIEGKRLALADPTTTEPRSKILEDINALAFEIARLRTGPLAQTLSAAIPLGEKPTQIETVLQFKYDGLREAWFEVPHERRPSPAPGVPEPEPIERPLKDDELNQLFGVSWNSERIDADSGLSGASSRTLKSCSLSIAVPSQSRGKITAVPNGSAISELSSASVETTISQWGDPDELCLSARLGENRTVNVAFNPFGLRKSLAWTAQARAEAVSSAISSFANNAAVLQATFAGQSELDRQKEAIARVTTQLQYNAAKLCEEAAEAGATKCLDPKSSD